MEPPLPLPLPLPPEVSAEGAGKRAPVRIEPSIGTPLSPALRQRMRRLTGFDPGSVRLHTGGATVRAAAALGAAAFTVGPEVHLGRGGFDPGDPRDVHLLAHELVHVRQQPATRPFQPGELSPAGMASLEASASGGHHVAPARTPPAPVAMVHGRPVVPLRAPLEDEPASGGGAEEVAPTPAEPPAKPDSDALLRELERRLWHRLRIEHERSGVRTWR
ncbi:eCIS core domain-containing protein [Streptomyces sp. UC4497]